MKEETTKRPVIMYATIAMLCIATNIIAFAFQFLYYELPCPLCLLQRFGFMAIGLGATLSLTDKPAFKYDAIIILSSVYTLIVGLRQVLLHIVPNDNGYGSTFLGLHFYTWSALVSFGLILAMSIIPTISDNLGKLSILQFDMKLITKVVEISFLLIILANIVATFLECGFTLCPSDPTSYQELKNLHLFTPAAK